MSKNPAGDKYRCDGKLIAYVRLDEDGKYAVWVLEDGEEMLEFDSFELLAEAREAADRWVIENYESKGKQVEHIIPTPPPPRLTNDGHEMLYIIERHWSSPGNSMHDPSTSGVERVYETTDEQDAKDTLALYDKLRRQLFKMRRNWGSYSSPYRLRAKPMRDVSHQQLLDMQIAEEKRRFEEYEHYRKLREGK